MKKFLEKFDMIVVLVVGGICFLIALWGRYYSFMILNIILALVPVVLLSGLEKNWNWFKKKFWFVLLILISTVVFLPNTVYLLTDLIYVDLNHNHFIDRSDLSFNILKYQPELGSKLWIELMFLFCAAWFGMVLNVVAVQKIFWVFSKMKFKITEEIVFVILAFLNAFGVFIGRFVRFNSWDLITDFGGILKWFGNDFLSYLSNPDFYEFVFGLVLVQGLVYVMIRKKIS